MNPVTVTFCLAAAAAVLGALAVVFSANVLYAAMGLFLALGGVALVFGLLGADLLAAVQIIVYVGGILVLVLFGVLLTTRIYQVKIKEQVFHPLIGLVAAALLFMLVGLTVWFTPWPAGQLSLEPTASTLGDLLLGKYLLPFEIVSLLLLAAIVSAAVMVRREVREEEEEGRP